MKIKKVYLGRRQIYPDEPRTPGVNTVFYIKGEGDIKDYGPNNYQFTNNLVTITDDYLNFPGTSKNRLINTTASIPQTYTFNARLYITGVGTNYAPRIIASADGSSATDKYIACYKGAETPVYGLCYNSGIGNGPVLQTNKWFNLVITRVQNGQTKVYINSINEDTETTQSANYGTGIVLGCKNSSSRDSYQGRMARIILENKERTAEEVSTYFNKTKGNYGIS